MQSDRPLPPDADVNTRLARIERLLERVLSTKSNAPERWVDSAAIEKHFDVSRATVHNWVHHATNPCPHEIRGKVLRFQLSAVDAWYRSRGTRQ